MFLKHSSFLTQLYTHTHGSAEWVGAASEHIVVQGDEQILRGVLQLLARSSNETDASV